MAKKLITLAMTLAFTVSVVGISLAGRTDCEVEKIEKDTVTMKCRSTEGMKEGTKVKVMYRGGASKSRGIEGC
ncbi:MAG: selenite/tellurite reduction operon protein ExtJ [Desulfurivibrionaceae bacterium]